MKTSLSKKELKSRTWVGVKKLAVVPTFNTQFDPPPPDNWNELVRRRVFYDPDPATGIDRSLRAYIEAISYGRAIFEAHLFPFAFADGFGVFEAAADSLPDGHGFVYLLCVIPMYDGHVHRKAYFQEMTRNGVTFRAARVAMNNGPLRQPMGVWAMEVLHAMAELPDLYTAPLPPGTGRMDRYDNMTYNAGTHSCASCAPGGLTPPMWRYRRATTAGSGSTICSQWDSPGRRPAA